MQTIIPVLIASLCMFAHVPVWAAPEDDGPYSCTKYTESIPARDGGTIAACVYTNRRTGERPLIVFRHGFSRTKRIT